MSRATTSAAGWLACLLLWPGAAQAHGAAATDWNFDAWVVWPLLLSAGLYLRGVAALWRRAGAGRGIRYWQASCYLGGWLVLVGALVSPLHALGEMLFTAHMVEHEAVMAVAAPLLALSRPVGAFLWALPPGLRRRIGRQAGRPAWQRIWAVLTRPLPATAWHGGLIWLWHVPQLFDDVLASLPLHRLQHATFLASGLAFWWALLRRCDRGFAAMLVFATMIHTSVLGALIAFAPRVLYPRQTAAAPAWGLSPLEDQQLAGLVMWVPAGTIYAAACLAFLAAWVRGTTLRWEAGHAFPEA